MKVASEVSAEKLRGGFYTPDSLVQLCLRRIAELVPDGRLRVVEPSVGDGAFVRNLSHSALASRVSSVTAIEPLELEAEKARRALATTGVRGDVFVRSAIDWAATTTETFDAAVGNPPFVRYQFVSSADRTSSLDLARRLGLRFGGVSNLWIPVLIGAFSRLRAGGAFAFVVPTECLTGCSASLVRRWLVDNCDGVRFDLFQAGSFPGVLQEVAILSGRVANGAPTHARLRVRIADHTARDRTVDWTHDVADHGPWTKLLLAPAQVAAFEAAAGGHAVSTLGSVVAFEVSIVTGANDFFTVPDETVATFGLGHWSRPLLPRIRYADGLLYTAEDHERTRSGGARAWLLDFGKSPDPIREIGPSQYIRRGELRGLHTRYKCRIREPWFRVPGIVSGDLLLAKRSHLHPRVVVNDAGVYTTDTIYRGRMLDSAVAPTTVAANFHSSLTLLSAELEGRSFGGGVLELVPSEIGRLLLATTAVDPEQIAHLDRIARAGDSDALIRETDRRLIESGAVDSDVVQELDKARRALLARRLERNRASEQFSDVLQRPAA